MVACAPVQCNDPLECECGWPMKVSDCSHGQKDDPKAPSCPDLAHGPSEAHSADYVAAAIPLHSVAFACEAPVVHPVVGAPAAAAAAVAPMTGMVGHALHAMVLHTAGSAPCMADAKGYRQADHPPGLSHAYSHSPTAHQPASMHHLDACLAADSAGAGTDCWHAAFGGMSNLDSLAATAHDPPCSQMSAEQDHHLQTRLSILQMAHVMVTAWNLRGSQLSRFLTNAACYAV